MLAHADEATKEERANAHRKDHREKRKVHRDLRRKEKAEKRQIHREICSDVFDRIMEIVDEASYTIKKEGALERKRWREWMETFKEGGQVSQFESAAFLGVSTQIEYEVPEEVEKGLENVDLDELQNYLACIGRWRTEHLFHNAESVGFLEETLAQEGLEMPVLDTQVRENLVLGDVLEEILETEFRAKEQAKRRAEEPKQGGPKLTTPLEEEKS